ncbi:MAG: ribokinase [Paludibacteraceae bacterium]|nr:ribokinase [Paludibacteraceae bacterium]
MNSRKILVVGSSNTDMVVKSERLPVPGETVLGNSFMMNPGGKGANQAVASSRLGGNVTFITKTGNDLFGRQSIELFTEENINTNYVFSDPNHPSGVALIMVDSLGENCIVVASGANMSLSPHDIEKSKNAFEQADILLMQLEIPMQTVEYAAKIAFEKGIKVILNPAPAAFLSNDLFKCLYVIVPNKTEAEVLSGINVSDIDSAKRAADIIASKGVNIVVITLGSKGALIKDGNEYNYVEAEKVEAVDTTAAGDTFCGALSVALSEGLSIVEAVKLANKASAITVTREGAQNSIPYRNEIQF